MCRDWFVVEGEKPMKIELALDHIIEREYNKYSPPECKTPGFDRQ